MMTNLANERLKRRRQSTERELGGYYGPTLVSEEEMANKDKWISKKISKLVKEGKPKDQAVAIAHSMYKDKKGK